MKRIKNLINLIKISTKAQLITGAVAASVIGTASVGGVVMYNHAQQNNENAKSTEVVQLEVDEATKATLEGLKKQFDVLRKKSYTLINTDKMNVVRSEIKSFRVAYEEKDVKSCEKSLGELEKLIAEVIESNKELLAKELEALKSADTSQLSEEEKKSVEEKIAEIEELVNGERFAEAYDKVKLAKVTAKVEGGTTDKKEEDDKKVESSTSGDSSSNSANGSTSAPSTPSAPSAPSTPSTPPVAQSAPSAPSTPAPQAPSVPAPSTPPPAAPSTPSIPSGWKNDVAQQVIARFSTSNTNNTDLNDQSSVMTPEYYLFLVSTCNSWVDGSISASQAKSLMAETKFNFFDIGEFSLINSVVASFEVSGLDSDAIVSKIGSSYWAGNHFIFCKVYYDSSRDVSTVYIVNGVIDF